jgi:hypothetical protein
MNEMSGGKVFGLSGAWLVGIIVLLVAVTFAGLGWRYVIAGPSGAVGAKEQQQAATTRVQKQEQFEQLAADFDGYLVKIGIASDALAAAQKSGNQIDAELRQTELVGLKQTCVDAAQQFNAESRKYTARVWKSAGLPPTLDAALCR